MNKSNFIKWLIEIGHSKSVQSNYPLYLEKYIPEYLKATLDIDFNNLFQIDEIEKIDDVLTLFNSDTNLINYNVEKSGFPSASLKKYREFLKSYKIEYSNSLLNSNSQLGIETTTNYSAREVENMIYNYIVDTGYPKNNIHLNKRIYTSQYLPDISIDFENKTIAIVEIKAKNRREYPNIDQKISMQIESYYHQILLNQDVIPRLFLVFHEDSLYTFYEYDIKTQKILKHDRFPNYDYLVKTINIKTSKESDNIWDNFTKEINLNKLKKIQKGVNDENLVEGLKIRDFLNKLKNDLIQKIPLLNNYKAEQNQAPTQQYWTPDNGFRLCFYKGDSAQNETQINITVWSNWGGGIFIKDNKKILLNNKELFTKISKQFDIIYDEKNLHIMIVSFKNNFPKYNIVIESLKVLITIYNEIEDDLNKENEIKISENTFTDINNDNVISLKDDGLSIADDVDAIAKLITYEKLKPPLSIALFGKWGSGKSTFMKILEDRVEELSNLNNDLFCNSICHIKFNAWHYSDTNLWASLVSHIFKDLDKYINKNNYEDKISIYTELLDSQKDKLREKRCEKRKVKKESIKNIRKIKGIEEEKINTTKEIKKLELNDIKKEILKDERIQKELLEIGAKIDLKYGKEITSIINTYNDLQTTIGIYKKAINIFYNDQYFIWFLGVFLFILGVNIHFDSFYIYLASIIGVLYKGQELIKEYLEKIKPITETLKVFIENYENKENEIKRKKEEQKIELQKKIDDNNLKIKGIEEQIQVEKNKIDNIKKEIEKIKTGEYLANFIADRSNSNDYKQHLGLISVIREDFEQLKKHLKELGYNPKYNVERIVLYIDDLDRCPEDKVVKVLEAIHLLLAFDLFVVIVGVDSRWITNSLIKSYDLSNKEDADDNKATSYDYLEKIFQIPFKVKPLTNNSKSTLLDKLLENDIYDNKNENALLNDTGIELAGDNSSKEERTEEINMLNNNSSSREISEDAGFVNSNPLNDENDDDNQSNSDDDKYEKIRLSSAEINYINQLSEHIGDTPRTIKRFINIYRIIKNHNNIKYHMQNGKDDYKLILIILCFVFNDIDYLIDKKKSNLNLPKEIMDIYEDYNAETRKQYVDFILRFSFKDCNT